MTVTTARIVPKHLDVLAKSAISEQAALDWGIFSVVSADELPADLAHYKAARGLVFPLRQADGSVVHQIRLDEPLPDGGKYLQPAGTGAIINVPEVMAGRVGKVSKILVTEGTKQTIAACLYAPVDTLVIGIQGCANFSEKGVPLEVWSQLVNADDDATICFDADWTTNPNVWTAAKNLKGHLESNVFANVKLATLEGGGKLGLDDVLSTVPEASRTRLITTLVAKARASLGRPPAKNAKKAPRMTAASAAQNAPTMDWDGAAIREPDKIYERDAGQEPNVTPGVALAEFAARIVRTVTVTDDLNGGLSDVEHDLEVTFDVNDRRETSSIPAIPNDRIGDVEWWLAQVPRGRGTRVWYNHSSVATTRINEAIREYDKDSAEMTTMYRRTGWVVTDDGIVAYLHGGGAIGPDGEVGTTGARLSNPTYSKISFPDPTGVSKTELARCVSASLGVFEMLIDPLCYEAVMGSMAYAATGAPPRAGLFIAGKHGSGKSTITGLCASHYSTSFFPEGGDLMGSMNGTTNATAAIGEGCHHLAVIVDDVRKRGSVKRQEAQDDAVEDLIRRSYDGGAAGRARMRVDRTAGGKVVGSPADRANPLIIFTGEVLPSAEDVASTLERMISVKVTRETSLKPGASAKMVALGQSGDLPTAWAGYLQWLARKIRAAGGIAPWLAEVDTKREAIAEALITKMKHLGPRATKVASHPVVGLSLWLEFAVDCGAMSEQKAAERLLAAAERISKAADDHATVELGAEVSAHERILERLRQGLAADRFTLSTAGPGLTVIGRPHTMTIDGATGAYVVLYPDEVARALGGMRGLDVTSALKAVAVMNSQGRTGWTLSRVRNAICIAEDVFSGAEDPKATPGEPE